MTARVGRDERVSYGAQAGRDGWTEGVREYISCPLVCWLSSWLMVKKEVEARRTRGAPGLESRGAHVKDFGGVCLAQQCNCRERPLVHLLRSNVAGWRARGVVVSSKVLFSVRTKKCAPEAETGAPAERTLTPEKWLSSSISRAAGVSDCLAKSPFGCVAAPASSAA